MRGLEFWKSEDQLAVHGTRVWSPGALLGLLAVLVLACSSDPSAGADSTPSADAAAPCELLTEALVRASFDVPTEIVIEQDDNSSSRFPNCGYRWRVMSEEEEQARRVENEAEMLANIEAGRSLNEGIQHNLRTHATTRLTTARFDDAEQAMAALEAVHERMTKGFEFEAAGKTRTYDPKKAWKPVDGVGDAAYYHGGQLSFVSGHTLAHLDATPMETATALANTLFR